jgi:Zinc carboxypeptidase
VLCLDLASGGSDDWAKGVAGVKYSYTVELRDAGRHGFLLPATAIEPSGNEMFQALRTLALSLLKERRQVSQLQKHRKRQHRN